MLETTEVLSLLAPTHLLGLAGKRKSYGLMEASFEQFTKLPREESGRPLVVTVLFISLGLGNCFGMCSNAFKTWRFSFLSMVSFPSPTLHNTSEAIVFVKGLPLPPCRTAKLPGSRKTEGPKHTLSLGGMRVQ